MSTRAFITLTVSVLLIGGILGGAFVGGFVLGKEQSPDSEEANLNGLPSPSGGLPQATQGGGLGQQGLSALQQGLQDGELSQEDIDNLRQQFLQGQGGQIGRRTQQGGGFGGPGVGFGEALIGTVEGVDGNTLTLTTPQGPLKATIGEDTLIQMMAESALSDLTLGQNVTVTGERGEDGTVTATSVFVVPERLGGQGGFRGGNFALTDPSEPTEDGGSE